MTAVASAWTFGNRVGIRRASVNVLTPAAFANGEIFFPISKQKSPPFSGLDHASGKGPDQYR